MKSNLNKIITKGYPLAKNRNTLGAWQSKPLPALGGREGGRAAEAFWQQSRRAQVRTNFSSSTDTSQGNTTNY